MEPEAVLNLFDSYWFHNKIPSETSTSSTPEPQHQENSPRAKVSRQLTIHTRSKSDQLIVNIDPGDISSPNSIHFGPHLQTILSEKEFSQETPKTPNRDKRFYRRKEKRRLSKSLSELEFEEVKGFMDLGFVFSEEDKDSDLVEIIPGLQRLGDQRTVDEEFNGPRARPYLSEAWEVSKRREEEITPLMNWRVPAVSNQIDMKDSLKWWAHTVASAVR